MFKSIYYIHFKDELEFKGTYTQKKTMNTSKYEYEACFKCKF